MEHNKYQVNATGQRHGQIFLLHFMLFHCYSTIVVLSVAIVAMTDPTINPSQEVYDWENTSIILSSFFWGYICFQIPFGQMAEKYGAKWLVLITMMINTFFFFLIPFLARYGSWTVILCRIAQGLSQGSSFPCTYYMLGKWVPANERSTLTSVVLSGMFAGAVVAIPITEWICSTSLGWPFSFYIFSIVGVVWAVFWVIFACDSPRKHKTISRKELEYIEMSLGSSDSTKELPVPWRSIFRSVPFGALSFFHVMSVWGYTTSLTKTPAYLNSILGFNSSSNAILSMCPYLVRVSLAPVVGVIADSWINRKLWSVGLTRKLISIIGSSITGASLIVLGVLQPGEDLATLALVMLIVSQGAGAFATGGYLTNPIDLSPRLAGTLMSFSNTIATVGSICGPLVVQSIVSDESDVSQWSIVFFMSAAFEIAGCGIFMIFGSGEKQSWDDTSKAEDDILEAEDNVVTLRGCCK